MKGKDASNPNHPEMARRRIESCGYRVVGRRVYREPDGGWFYADVVDSRMGRPCGRRWTLWTSEAGWQVKAVRPSSPAEAAA